MRWKLLITAVADGQCALLLADSYGLMQWELRAALAVALMSLGLYAGGMTLNDMVDSRRDAFLHPGKPIPSGRISRAAARLWCVAWFVLGCIGGVATAAGSDSPLISGFFLAWTVLLILFYNFVGKFLGSSGILSLGLVRFFHAAVPQPLLVVIAHPLLLLNHVVALTGVCYVLENKRPRLSRLQRWFTAGTLLLVNLLILGGLVLVTVWRRTLADVPERLGLQWGLLYPMLAALVFWAVAAMVLRRLPRQPASAAEVTPAQERLWLSQRQRLDAASCSWVFSGW
jgi:4-hydroxybenzoate polyprenyltransferase